MASTKITLNTRQVANVYAGPEERILEFSSPNGGGLIAFRLHQDGRLLVDVYRQDATVEVRVGKPEDAR